jgi:hypothetical protein
MQLSRAHYNSLLDQLTKQIAAAEDQLNRLRLQEKVSKFFLELHDSDTKETKVPVCTFLTVVLGSPNYFECEPNREKSKVKVNRRDGKYWLDEFKEFDSYFLAGELEKLCSEAEWEKNSDDTEWCEIDMEWLIVRPAWTFVDEKVVSATNGS